MAISERVEFAGANGHHLAARFERAQAPEQAVAIFAHCFSCSKDVFAASRISAGLAERGISVLRFDFTGLGASGGDFANTNFSSNVMDLIAAAAWLRGQGHAPSLLVGHSLGGAACIMAAGQIPEVRALVTLGAPAHADHVAAQFSESIKEIEAQGEAEVLLGGRSFRLKREFLDDVRAQKVLVAAGQLHRALLILHAPLDSTVGIENAAEIFNAAKHPKSFVSLDGADHLLTRKADANYAADVIAAWASRYIGTAPRPAKSAPPAPQSGAEQAQTDTPAFPVLVEESGGQLRNRVTAGHHRLLAGEPASLGGEDSGPSPFQWLAAGLGACTSMTMRLYADRKGWPVGDISVAVDHIKRGPDEPGHPDVFTRTIRLTGPLTEEQRQRLLEIAEKCPVHRTLVRGADVPTLLVPRENDQTFT